MNKTVQKSDSLTEKHAKNLTCKSCSFTPSFHPDTIQTHLEAHSICVCGGQMIPAKASKKK
jgi:hypothetical protein